MLKEPVQVESTRSKKAPKVLANIRIHRALDGGHHVEHHYTHFEHAPRTYSFGPEEGHRAAAHIHRHAGLPPVHGAGSMHENAAEEHEPSPA